jgi:hypothetical protein
MANIEVDHAAGAVQRPTAFVEAYRAVQRVDQMNHRPPPPALPRFCRVDVGQLIRALLLIVLCLGFAQLPCVDGAPADRTSADGRLPATLAAANPM